MKLVPNVRTGEMSQENNEQFIAWWNSNWPDFAPTHQALHAWKAGYEAALKANEIKCWHKEIDEKGICKNCGARAAIELEGMHPPGPKTVGLLSVQDSNKKTGGGGLPHEV